MNASRIVVIGDSHVCFFSGKDQIINEYPQYEDNWPFRMYRLGAPLAYTLPREQTVYMARAKIKELLKNEISPDDKLLFVFGEIDCRYHIIKKANESGDTLPKQVVAFVTQYLIGIKTLDIKNEIGIWGPIPTTRLGAEYCNNDRPICGNSTQRNIVTFMFNQCLLDFSKKYDYKFFTVFHNLVSQQMVTQWQYYMDDIHLSQKAWPFAVEAMKEWL